MLGLQTFFNFEALRARLQVYLQAGRAVLSPAYIANQSARPHDDGRLLLFLLNRMVRSSLHDQCRLRAYDSRFLHSAGCVRRMQFQLTQSGLHAQPEPFAPTCCELSKLYALGLHLPQVASPRMHLQLVRFYTLPAARTLRTSVGGLRGKLL